MKRAASEYELPRQPQTWNEFTTAASMGLPVVTYQRMKMAGCPPAFFELLIIVHMCDPTQSQSLIMLEMFCGVAAISRAFDAAGLAAMGYDYLKDPLMNDILLPTGFLHAIAMVMSLDQTYGFLWLATVCSSWIWMSQGSTGRSNAFPLGIPCKSVDEANMMVARCGLLIIMCIAKGCAWALEQPSSSLMCQHPAMLWIKSLQGRLTNADWVEADTYMGAFDGDTLKPSKLTGNRQLVKALGRSQPKRGNFDSSQVSVVKVHQLTGQKIVAGGPGLKQTQAYTDEFGQAVLDAYIQLGSGERVADTEPGTEAPYPFPEDVWVLADLPSVLLAARRG